MNNARFNCLRPGVQQVWVVKGFAETGNKSVTLRILLSKSVAVLAIMLIVFISFSQSVHAAIEYHSDDVPVAIPDQETIISTLDVADTGTILDLNVKLSIRHWWVEDLDVFLIAPDGTLVELFTDVGGDGIDFKDTILDNEASDFIIEGSAPFIGSYRPEGSLSDFYGKSITGKWKLEVTDDAWLISGTLDSWSLIVELDSNCVLFEDSFRSTNLDPDNWTVVNGATVDNVGINEPSPEYSLRLNGHPSGGDLVESREIDLSSCSIAKLIYWYERTGSGDSPGPGEDLIIEYWYFSNWIECDRQPGDGLDMTDYNKVIIDLPLNALHAGFRFRMRSIGTSFFSSILDDWFIDDVSVTFCDGGTNGFRILSSTGLGGSNPFSLVELRMDPLEEVFLGEAGFNPGLDFDPTGVLYGASSDLRIIDPEDGSHTTIGLIRTVTGQDILVNSIAFHPNGTLYAMDMEFVDVDNDGDDEDAYNILYNIDPSTAVAKEVCRRSFFNDPGTVVWGIDFSPDGTLYGAFSQLVILDITSCQVIKVCGNIPEYVVDIDYAPDKHIYAVNYISSKLYRIDPLNCTIETFGPYDSELWGVVSQVIEGTVINQSTECLAPLSAIEDSVTGISAGVNLNALEEQAQQVELQRVIELQQR